ncbi:SOS response-associated peptidase [Paenibacillus sp. JCM 10914]|uniref:SOS response-associated peptidase n=1 Tax=Paenibacillus sp. JCM 10914 TaxID=1236974 RepID=UPI0003CC6EE5|nr:SOS response-associated peptidase [Paenibacillus sp. JCM 10914]GAE04425.1 Gifsy-2 prophage protein [Paenibacillus sp. JCM 10914]
MCGRFTLTVTWEELLTRYLIDPELLTPFHVPRYNIAPTQMVTAIINDGTANRIGQLQWGLVPSWSKDAAASAKMMNARSETLEEKPAYRIPFYRKRCLIPADGFYEWQKTDIGKQPYRISLRSGEIFSMAGLYDTWITPSGERLSTCTVITTEPNELMAPIHNRMPVILKRSDEALWLKRNPLSGGNQEPDRSSLEAMKNLLQPYPDRELQAVPVSTTVNSVKNDSAECIRRVSGSD